MCGRTKAIIISPRKPPRKSLRTRILEGAQERDEVVEQVYPEAVRDDEVRLEEVDTEHEDEEAEDEAAPAGDYVEGAAVEPVLEDAFA